MKDSLRDPANLAAALGYYRATLGAGARSPELRRRRGRRRRRRSTQPTLYLHGPDDGCMGAELVDESVLGVAARRRLTDRGASPTPATSCTLEQPDGGQPPDRRLPRGLTTGAVGPVPTDVAPRGVARRPVRRAAPAVVRGAATRPAVAPHPRPVAGLVAELMLQQTQVSAGRPPLRGVPRPVADARGVRRRAAGGGRSPPGPASGTTGGPSTSTVRQGGRRRPRWRPPRTTSPVCSPCPGSARTRPGPCSPSPTSATTWASWTPTPPGCWPGGPVDALGAGRGPGGGRPGGARAAGAGPGTRPCSTSGPRSAGPAARLRALPAPPPAAPGRRRQPGSRTRPSARRASPVASPGSRDRTVRDAGAWSTPSGSDRVGPGGLALAAGWPDDSERAVRVAQTLVADGLAVVDPDGTLRPARLIDRSGPVHRPRGGDVGEREARAQRLDQPADLLGQRGLLALGAGGEVAGGEDPGHQRVGVSCWR